MKHIKLFENFQLKAYNLISQKDKNILDSDFIINTLNDIKKEAFHKNPTYKDTRDDKIYSKPNPTHDQIGFKWNSKNIQLTIEVKPEEEYSRFGLSKEVAEEELKDNMPMFGDRISYILSEATKRIEEKGISLEEGDDSSHGKSGFKLLSTHKFSDVIEMRYLLLVSK